MERDAHFEQRMQDSLQFRTQDGNPVSVIMIYLGRGGYMADAAEKAIDLGFPAGVEAVGVIAPTSTDRRWSFGLRGDSYSSERLTTYDEIASVQALSTLPNVDVSVRAQAMPGSISVLTNTYLSTRRMTLKDMARSGTSRKECARGVTSPCTSCVTALLSVRLNMRLQR